MNFTSTGMSPEALRETLIDVIKEAGHARTRAVEDALRAVERHHYVPHVDPVDAYANDIVVTKRTPEGEVLSCASQPAVVALLLDQLRPRRGDRVLEIGAGTGYNAALLAHLVGEGGHVTAIDVDADIVDHARERLTAAGVGNAEVVHGDGARGHEPGAPYDGIIASVGAYGIPDSWLTQLAPAGRLVIPLRIRGSVSRSIAFERAPTGGWRSAEHAMCGFVPLRGGIADDPRSRIDLTGDTSVTLQSHQDQPFAPGRLTGVLDQPRREVWTGVTFARRESLEWMYLWLTCALPGGLRSMPVQQAAFDSGRVTPMFRTGMAVPGDGEVAYLAKRPGGYDSDGHELTETGVVGHGPHGGGLAARVAEEIRAWDSNFRHRGVRFEIPADGTDTSDPTRGRFFLDRPHHPITVVWE
ncbi:methyltransferase, FxLD system [Amycolatopsis coloradensis]|uniref:Protein-L-isoaspartate O-methyltransferase n=1 Tax=Amycolatopsis coloradensis TaxID=76021 RepID=A0A1R0KU29_9PSEU|nr:methyltransferase, FxLD system [Amycolatopsis coloradensis]OLZ51639.1 methyltransferase, FxLD system [Amycolatopsis coloradensis]